MPVLYALEQIRTPILNTLMSLITNLGDQTLLLAVGMVVIWCVDKKWGYRLFFLGVLGASINQLLKAAFTVPRPWVKDPSFTIVESARAAATGYSFPSGHTQNSALLFGGIAIWLKKWLVYISAFIVSLLVGFSRMYLGVHTPLDVITSLTISVALLFTTSIVFRLFANSNNDDNKPLCIFGAISLVLAATAVCMLLATGDQSGAEGLSDSFSALGGALGLAFIYVMDKKYLNFPIDAVWWAQIAKCAVGFLLIMAARVLLKTPLNTLFNGHAAANGIRYFIMAVIGGVVWPLSFKWFSRIGR